MNRRIIIAVLAVLALVMIQVVTAPAQTGKETPTKPAVTMPMGQHHRFANSLAVCGCGKVFMPDANTKTFTYEGKEYACCSDECHKKLAAMTPADAAKLCEDQVKKLTASPAPAATTKK